MARQLRVEYPGAIYHVTCRMVGDWRTEKTLLFKDDADRERFLERLAERVEQFHIRLYLFVLMTNHFHLVFETPEANCSKFMHSLSTAYTVYYNRRHRRHGHLLDGRFKAKLVDGDDYLLALSRYVHLNPVQVGAMKAKPIEERIEALRAWRWSSYPRPEDISFRHTTEPLLPDEVLAVVAELFTVDVSAFGCRRHGSALRGVAAKCLIRFAGQTQREVAEKIGVGTGSAVSNQLKLLSRKLDDDRNLRRLLKQAETMLENKKSERSARPRRNAYI